MTHRLRVHKVSNHTTTPQERGEIRQFIEAVFTDRAHTLYVRDTPSHLLFYLRMERRPDTKQMRREREDGKQK